MEDPERLRREYHLHVVVLQHQYDIIELTLHQIRDNRMRRRRQRRRRVWVRPWIGRRRLFGLYDQLLVELRNEDEASFMNFMRMSPEMFEMFLLVLSALGWREEVEAVESREEERSPSPEGGDGERGHPWRHHEQLMVKIVV
jgi:hypothetical protein